MTTIDLYSKNQSDDLFDKKQDTLKSGENIKTINGASIVGSGNLVVDGAVLVSSSIPSSAILGQLWYEPTTDRIFICTHPSSSTTRPTFGLLFDNSGSVEHSRWGDITGDIHQQLDLMLELATKQGILTAEGKIKIENDTITVDLSDYFTKEEVTVLVDNKQDKLTAGANISIENNVISASVPDAYTKAETDALLAEKQNELSSVNEGNNIKITYDATGNPLINATGSGGSEYTGIAPIVVDNTADTIGIQPTGVGSGSVGSSTRVPVIGYDNNGRITSVSDVPVSGGGTEYTGIAPIIVDNSTYRISLDESDIQGKLTAGQNITIDANNVISATGTGSYSAGDGIEISNNEISAKIGDGLQFDSSGAIEVVGGSTDGVKTINSIEPSSEGNIQLAGEINPINSLPFITISNGGTQGTNFALPMFEVQECIFTVDADTNTSTGTVTFGRTYLRPPLLFFMCLDSTSRDYGVHVKSITTSGAVLHSASNFSTTGGTTIYCLIVPRE